MVRITAAILSLILLVNTMLFAQSAEIPLGRWNKVEAEAPGTGIIVTMKGGEVISCFLKSLSTDMLTVLTEDSKERTMPKSSVAKIVTREKRSGPLWNGAVIGAAIPGIIGIIACAGGHGGSPCFGGVAIMAGLGAGIGVAIDAGIKGQIKLYEAPAPRK